MIKMIMKGDWAKAAKILDTAEQLRNAINWAVEKEAQDARRRIVKGIREQSPGGQDFKPLSPITLALRRAKGFKGSKALIETAQLMKSVTVRRAGNGIYFVGVLKTAQRADGKKLYNIARVHEMGARIPIRVTLRMHNYLMAMLRKYSPAFRRKRGRDFDRKAVFSYNKKSQAGTLKNVVITIPPRPFIRPVIEEMAATPEAMRRRMAMRVAQRMKFALGKP